MMTSYDVVLFLISLLLGLALRRAAAPMAELGIIEQLERKLNSLENQKRKLKRQLSDFRTRACKSESRLLDDVATSRDGLAQKSIRSMAELEDVADLYGHNREETFKLLHFCRSAVLENLEGAIELADRRNSAVSKLYFDLFGETNGNVQLLSELTDPWRRWAELLACQRDRMDRVFAHCLDRASRNKRISLDELPASVGLQEPDHGFDRILDLVRVRLSPMSRSESLADFEYMPSADSPTSTVCGGANGSFVRFRKTGYLRLARTLHRRMPEVPEERLVACLETLRTQNGGLTGLRISEIREEVSRLVQDWPSAIR
uniref:Secreted protein n=1 Tax=Ixodes ricinus TaxID=34613 RepID=A0A147BLY0_IXORI